MNNAVPYADIIILALIAGFILLRLRNVLGQKTGQEDEDFLRRLKPVNQVQEPVVQITDKSIKNKHKEESDSYISLISDKAVLAVITEIKAKDPHFTATRFLDGARMAFEMVHEAFVKGDKQTLSMLLSEPLYKDFTAEIETRSSQERRTETTLVSIISKDIAGASLSGTLARITVKFISEQIAVVRNAKGDIVEGNPSEAQHVEDEWVFERDIASKNPNWKIIET